MQEPELTPYPVAGDDGSDNFFGLFYPVDEKALEEWAKVTNFMMGGLGFSVEEPDITTNFRGFLLIMYGNNWEKRILCCTTMVIEQLKSLIPGFCKLTDYQKTQWAEHFDIWPPSALRVQLRGLAESRVFLEKEKAPGLLRRWGGNSAHQTYILL